MAGADFVSEGSSSFLSESDSCRSDSSLSVSYSDIFFFPFSLRVSRLLGFLRGECTTESPLLAGSSSDWSYRLSLPFGPFNRSEIDFGLIRMHLGLADLIVRARIGVGVRSRRQVPGRGLIKHNVAAHARLFGARVITLITLLLVRVADQNTLLGFRVQLPPLLLRYMHIRNVTENSQVSQIRIRSEI